MKIEYSKGNRASKELILLNRQQFESTSGRKMKVMLIFPPDWFPSEPFLTIVDRRSPAGRTHRQSERHQLRDVGLVLQRGLSEEGVAPGATTT